MQGVSSVDRRRASVPVLRQWPRGPFNELHTAAGDGSTERTIGLLARGSININQGDPTGRTPLMLSCFHNDPSVVRILLNKGANSSIADDCGFTALHVSAQQGHLAVTTLLVEAGAELEATVGGRFTPLHLAVERRHPKVATALIQAGANVNHRTPAGGTPLFAAAWHGYVDCVRVLLHARADQLLVKADPSGAKSTPLEAAAQNGYPSVTRELIQHLMSDAAGRGASPGVEALCLAGEFGHVDVMAVLTDAGVVDTGRALCRAAGHGDEASVSFLLKQDQESNVTRGGLYASSRDQLDRPALVLCVANCRQCSPRIARLLIDAGADSTSAVLVADTAGSVVSHGTPLAMTKLSLRLKMIQGKPANEEQLHALKAIRRLLLQVDAVHAVSWVWPNRVFAITDGLNGTNRTTKASRIESPLSRMLPTLRLRTTRPRVLWAALLRYSKKL